MLLTPGTTTGPLLFPTRSIAGIPSGTASISVSGGTLPYSLKFIDMNVVTVSTNVVGVGDGNIQLPVKADRYTTMVTDAVGARFYGCSVVNSSKVGTFSPMTGLSLGNLPGYGSFGAWHIVQYAVGDTNSDGWLDTAFGSGYTFTSSPTGNGSSTGSFTLNQTVKPGGISTAYADVRFADLNGDGILDLVFAYYRVPKIFVSYGSVGGFDVVPTQFLLSGLPTGTNVELMTCNITDVDRDNKNDVVVYASTVDTSSNPGVASWMISPLTATQPAAHVPHRCQR